MTGNGPVAPCGVNTRAGIIPAAPPTWITRSVTPDGGVATLRSAIARITPSVKVGCWRADCGSSVWYGRSLRSSISASITARFCGAGATPLAATPGMPSGSVAASG